MPQLSLYVDEDVHRELEERARINNVSVSKFVISILKKQFIKSWPEGYENIFGSVDDDSFIKQQAPDWQLDTPRGTL